MFKYSYSQLSDMKTFTAALLVGCLGVVSTGFAQGMPPEARKNIHALFNQHEAVTRTVTLTQDGYVAVTESNDPKLAATLKEHVAQMEKRLQSGLMVRRHDPAFAEFAAHYRDIRHTVEATEKGLKVTVTAKTADAVRVAQNHANVVSDFAAHGWEAHDRDHAAVLATPANRSAAPAPATSASKAAPACCEGGGGCQSGACAAKPDSAAAKFPAKSTDKH